jgi:hypothetical protein
MPIKQEDPRLNGWRRWPLDGGDDSFTFRFRQRFRTAEEHSRAADIYGFSFTAERNDLTRADEKPDRELNWVSRMGPTFLRQSFKCPS